MTPNELDALENSTRKQSAAGQMYDDLMNGTFYEKQDVAIRSMGGKPKYIYEPEPKKSLAEIIDEI